MLSTQVFLDTHATEGIRAAIAADVQRSFSTATMRALIEHTDTVLRVAERPGHWFMFAQLTRGARQDAAPSALPAELDHLYVQEVTSLWLTVWVGNARARSFYPRCVVQTSAKPGSRWTTCGMRTAC